MSEPTHEIKFTGDPVKFDGVEGRRDPKTGKGRFDLIPEEVYPALFDRVNKLIGTVDFIIDCREENIFLYIANGSYIDAIICMTLLVYADDENTGHHFSLRKDFYPAFWKMLRDLAIHFQKGAEHYGERNCQKGIPLWSFKDSAMRHATQVFSGLTDEPHAISVIWNCWMAAWTELVIVPGPELEIIPIPEETEET